MTSVKKKRNQVVNARRLKSQARNAKNNHDILDTDKLNTSQQNRLTINRGKDNSRVSLFKENK